MKVELVTHSGSDLLVVDAARASFSKKSEMVVVKTEVEVDEEGRSYAEYPVFGLSNRDVKLVNYLARERHMLPFRHPQVTLRCKAPLFVARQVGKHQVGMCLTGDTKVSFVKKSNGISNGIRETTMEDLYRMWSGQVKYQGGAKGKRNVSNAHVRVFNEDAQRFETSHICNVIYSGVKDVYEVTTAEGLAIKASADHDFLTPEGWVKLKDLAVGSYLVSDREGKSYAHTEPPARGRDRAARQQFLLQQGEIVCEECGANDGVEVSHKEPVWRRPDLASSFDNMELLCRTCHVTKDSADRKCVSNLLPKATEIVAIDYVGREDTYDLSIDRIHNFVANGIVVHNSWSEESRRYITDDVEVYTPDVWRGKADNVKQGSSDEEIIDAHAVNTVVVSKALEGYKELLRIGVAPEMARMILPQAAMTTWVWTGSLLSFVHMIKERSASGAQKETRDFAVMVAEVIEPLYPVSYKALMEN